MTPTPSAITAIINLAAGPSPKTLPQARERLEQIHAEALKLAAASSATVSAATNRRGSLSTTATLEQASDHQLLATYETLTGQARTAFFVEHRAALARAHSHRANTLTPEEASLLGKYQSLEGAARQSFYRENERAIWAAHKRQQRAA